MKRGKALLASAGALAVGGLFMAGAATAGGSGGAAAGTGGHNCGVGMDMSGMLANETPTAGSTVRITGTAFDTQASPVNITWGDEKGPLLATVPLDETGGFARPVPIPADARGPSVMTVRQRVPSGKFFDPNSFAVHQLVFDVQEPSTADAVLSDADALAQPQGTGAETSDGLAVLSPWLLLPVGAFGVAAGGVLLHEVKRRKVEAKS